ncbi:MAG: mandelate racemase/muconate lactonizing enzyme family protein [bacterium]
MPLIRQIRTLLLSSPYAHAEHPEILECFPNGPKRTVGMVEITLDNGVKGVGEGYLAVFAPEVFRAIVDLCRPYLEGTEAFDRKERVRDLCRICDYWSLQGAARHVISAFEIALVDAHSKSLGKPAWQLFTDSPDASIRAYGSGGICDTKEHFTQEMDMLSQLGIDLFKIRSVKTDIHRTAWVLNEANKRGMKVGVDMCQNLANPPQAVNDVVQFIEQSQNLSGQEMAFVEEAIGPHDTEGFKELRKKTRVPVCGGEIITTPWDMISRMRDHVYEFVQPDASVIGGFSALEEIFAASEETKTAAVVHAWGGPVAMMANYHAAFGLGGKLVEYPMLAFPLGDVLLADSLRIENGHIICPTNPGIGIEITPEVEAEFPFDPEAVYSCKLLNRGAPSDESWKD